MSQRIRICFVCLGNIIRSPLAKNIFLTLIDKEGVSDHYEVDSAGTGDWHIGEPPDPRMQRVAARHGLVYTCRARQFRRRDFDAFDLILVMEEDNRQELLQLRPTPEQQAKIHLLREFDPQGGPNIPVPDPYYGGSEGFEEVYLVVERACQGLLDTLEEKRAQP